MRLRDYFVILIVIGLAGFVVNGIRKKKKSRACTGCSMCGCCNTEKHNCMCGEKGDGN